MYTFSYICLSVPVLWCFDGCISLFLFVYQTIFLYTCIDKWIPYHTSARLSAFLYLCFDVLIMLMCVIRLEIIPLMSLILHIITHNSIGAKLLKRFNKDGLSRELVKNRILMDGYLPLKNTRNVFRISKYVILKTYHSLSSC